MNMHIAYVICLVMIGCYSSTINRNRRELELDYETTTLPPDDTEDDDIYFIEEMSTVANLEVYDLDQNTEQQNDTELDEQNLLLESIILSFMEIDDSLENAAQSSSIFQSDISEPLDTSFFSQGEKFDPQIKNLEHDSKKVQEKSILFDDLSDPSYAESNIQKINQKKRNVSKKDFEELKDQTGRYAADFLDELIQNINILKNKKESIYYSGRYAERFLDEPNKKMDALEKYENSKEITEMYIENISDKPFAVIDFSTKPTEPRKRIKISSKEIPEISTKIKDLTDKPKESSGVTKTFTDDSILKAPKTLIDVFEKPELFKEYRNIHIETEPEKPMQIEDLLSVHKKPRDVVETYQDKVLQKSTDTVNASDENQKELIEYTKMNTEVVPDLLPSMPIDILENPEESTEFVKTHTKRVPEIPFIEFKDLSSINDKSLERIGGFVERVTKKPSDMIDVTSMQESKKLTSRYAQRFFKNPREPIDILAEHETKSQKFSENIPEELRIPLDRSEKYKDDKEFTKINVMRVPEKPIELIHILNKQERERDLSEVAERFPEKPTKLTEFLSEHKKPRVFNKVNAKIVSDESTYTDDVSEKQKEIMVKPTWRIDIVRNPENPQEFKKVYTEQVSDKYSDIIDGSVKHKEANRFTRMHIGSASDELTRPIDFLEKHEELQEFKKVHAKRDPEKLIDSIDILNKQEKPQKITGIYSETVPQKPNDLIDILNIREESRLPTGKRDEIMPEKTTQTMHTSEKQNQSKEFKRIYPQSMIDTPTMLMDILEKYRNPHAFTRVYTKERSDTPTGIIDIAFKHTGEINEFGRSYTESMSDKVITPTDGFENKEESDSTRIHAIKISEKPSELVDMSSANEKPRAHTKINAEIVSDKSTYATYVTEKPIKFNERTRMYPETTNDKSTWQTDILRKYENPQVFTGTYTKEFSDRPIERIDVAVKHNGDPNEFRRTYTKSVSDKVRIPTDGLDNNESREFTRMHAIRVMEKPSELVVDLSLNEKPRALTKINAKIVPDKSTYAIDVSEKQKELKERTFPETVMDKPTWRIDILRNHENLQGYTRVNTEEVSDRLTETMDRSIKHKGPNKFIRAYSEGKSGELVIPSNGLRNKETIESSRIHAMRVPETPFESTHILNKQEIPRTFTNIYADASSEPEIRQTLSKINSEVVPHESTYTTDVSEQQKELRGHTRIYAASIMDKPTWQIDIVRKHENPHGFTRVTEERGFTEEFSGSPTKIIDVSVKHKEPNEFTRTYTESISDEFTMPINILGKHKESRESTRIHASRVPEKTSELIDVLSLNERPQALTKVNPETVRDKVIYVMDVPEKQKQFQEFTRIHPETISDKPKMQIDSLEKHEESLAFADTSEKHEEADKFIRTYTDSTSDKLTMPTDVLEKHKESRDFSRIHAIRLSSDISNVREKPLTKINAQIVPDKGTYAMGVAEKQKEPEDLTGMYTESILNKPKMQMAFLEKHDKPLESEELYYKEVSSRLTQKTDVSKQHNEPKELNKMYTETIPDKPTMPIYVLRTHKEPQEFTKMHADRYPEKLSESIATLRSQGKPRELAKVFSERVLEKPYERIVALDRHDMLNASINTRGGVSKKFTEIRDISHSHDSSKEFRDIYAEKLSNFKLSTEKNSSNKVFGTVNQETHSDAKNDRENSKDVDSSVEKGPTYIGLGLEVPFFEKNNSKRQSFFRSSLRGANSKTPSTKIDTHRLTPDHLDELEPLPSLEFLDHADEEDLSEIQDDIQQPSFLESDSKKQTSTNSDQSTTIMKVPSTPFDTQRLLPNHLDKLGSLPPLESLDDEDGDNASDEYQDSIEQPSFIVRALSAVVSLYMSLRRSSSEIYQIFGRLFS